MAAKPEDTEIEDILSTVDSNTFKENDWNVAVLECKSLAAKWEQLSAYLGLPSSLINTIKGNHPNNITGCWSHALSEWTKQQYDTKKFGEPSWKSLLKVISIVDKSLFKELSAKYQGQHKLQEDSAVLGLETQAENYFTGRVVKSAGTEEALHKATINEQLMAKGVGETSTLSKGQKRRRIIVSETCDIVRKLTLSPETNLEDLHQKIHDDIKRMRDKFSRLQTMIRKNVKKNADHKELAAHIYGMYILNEAHEIQVANASTIDEIFYILPKYWSFLDFSNLENIAETFCSHECDTKKELNEYKHDVQQFCERRVSEFPQGALNNGTDIEGMDKVVVTLDLKDPSLRHVLNLKEVIADILGQPASKLVLCDIGTGSIVVTLWIATSLGEKLFLETSGAAKRLTQTQEDQLQEVRVLSVEFKEVIMFSIYPKVKKRKADSKKRLIRSREMTDNKQENLTFQCPCEQCTLDSYLKCGRPMSKATPFPYLDVDHLSEQEKEDTLRRLSKEESKVRKAFGNLLLKTCKSLNKRNAPVSEIANTILRLEVYDSENLNSKSLMSEKKSELNNAQTVDEIFDILSLKDDTHFF